MKLKYFYAAILILVITFASVLSIATVRGGRGEDPETEAITEAQTEKVTELVTELVTEPETTEMETETETVIEYIWQPSEKVGLSAELQQEIKTACDEAEISYELILAVMWVETRWNWHDGDDGNAIGYMQIWPKYWSGFAAERGLDIYEPFGNVKCGIAILDRYIEMNGGDLKRALQQYNTGSPDTNNGYAEKVFQALEMITEE